MGAGEEVLMTLGGGAPWGFRLQGGSDQQKPLQVAKVRKRSKAGRAGLCENDVLLSINGKSCCGISHADAMHIIDSSDGTLHILVKRVSWSPDTDCTPRASPSAQSTSPSKARLRSPLGCNMQRREVEIRRTAASPRESVLTSPESVTETNRRQLHVESYTSPPDSEAYYGETDSDADYITSEKQRRQKKKSPISSPRQSVKTSHSADEASEQSEYDSAPEHLHHSRSEPRGPTRNGNECKLSQASGAGVSAGHSRGGSAAPELGSCHPLHQQGRPVSSPAAQLDSGARTCSHNPVDHRNPPPGVAGRNREAMFQPRRVEAKINIWQPKAEVASYTDPWPVSGVGTADTGSRQGLPETSEADSGFQEVPAHPGSPEQGLLPSSTTVSLKDVQLVPMVGPVSNPVDEVLTTTYKEKARQAKLHRSESVQEKQVKEARTKCKTIASLLTSAPNPHSKGVLMFKKRRQRAKKYTLVSYGSVDEDRNNLDEDGEILPTSESEFDEEAFSDAKSLTNQSTGSDWDSSYLDVEKTKSEPQGLIETRSKGVLLFEHQRQRAVEHSNTEALMQHSAQQMKPKSTAEVMNCNLMNGESAWSRGSGLYGETPMHALTNVNNSPEVHMSSKVSAEPHLQTARSSQLQQPQPIAEEVSYPIGVTNRTARPFTSGFVQNQKGAPFSITRPVFFRQNAPSQTTVENKPTVQNRLAAPSSVISRPATITTSQLGSAENPLDPKKRMTLHSPSEKMPYSPYSPYSPPSSITPYSPPPSTTPYLPQPSVAPYSPPPSATPYSPPPAMTPYSPPPSTTANSTPPTVTPCSPLPSTTACSPPPAPYPSPPSAIPCSSPPSATTGSHPLVNPYSPPVGPVTTTATFHISSAGSQYTGSASNNVNGQTSSIGNPSSGSWSASQHSENLVTREQRISIPAARTGILQDARKRSTRKPMFTVTEQPKPSPNPELLSLVQNLDVKPKPDHLGAGFESGPEEDFLSLGAEASNFMQSQARKQKTPPPVAPKPHVKPYIVGYGPPLSNGNFASGIAQMKGKGAELFAKRQSRMDKFVVESVPTHHSHPRAPSPTPSLPSTWKYSPNIRAPPPIGYNPMHSPSYPPAACRSQAATSSAKMDKKGKLGVNQKVGIRAIDFMRHQPYQLNPAMFNFDSAKLGTQSLPRNLPSTQPGKQNNMSFISTKHVPVKTTRAYEIKRFSTPVPIMTPIVIAPRSATTLAEPVWMSAPTSPPPAPLQATSAPRVSQPVAFTSYELPRENIQKKTLIQVPKPRFVVAKAGAHSHTWRPGM